MPDYAATQAAMIQGMIDASRSVNQQMGTVISRETNTARAIVSFDGSSGIGQPVKCFENVVVTTGDRVGMVKFEGDWVIVGNYSATGLADVVSCFAYTSSATYIGATFSDMPSSPQTAFAKQRDLTQLQLGLAVACRSDTNDTTIEWALMLTFPDATTFDQVMFRRYTATIANHLDRVGGLTTNLTLPAGLYSATARWRRVSGSGTPTVDGNDSVTITVKEVWV